MADGEAEKGNNAGEIKITPLKPPHTSSPEHLHTPPKTPSKSEQNPPVPPDPKIPVIEVPYLSRGVYERDPIPMPAIAAGKDAKGADVIVLDGFKDSRAGEVEISVDGAGPGHVGVVVQENDRVIFNAQLEGGVKLSINQGIDNGMAKALREAAEVAKGAKHDFDPAAKLINDMAKKVSEGVGKAAK